MITKTNEVVLPSFVKMAIEDRLTVESKKLVEEAKKELERRTPEIVASIVVDIMSMVTFEDLKERVIFTIKKNEK